jgi:hypothetical protein
MIAPDLEALISETEQACTQAQREEAQKKAQERERKRAEDSMKRWERRRKIVGEEQVPRSVDWSQYTPTFVGHKNLLDALMPKPLVTGALTTKRLPKA